MATIAQFYIYSKSGNKLVYKYNRFTDKYYRGTTEISHDEYTKALQYFQTHR